MKDQKLIDFEEIATRKFWNKIKQVRRRLPMLEAQIKANWVTIDKGLKRLAKKALTRKAITRDELRNLWPEYFKMTMFITEKDVLEVFDGAEIVARLGTGSPFYNSGLDHRKFVFLETPEGIRSKIRVSQTGSPHRRVLSRRDLGIREPWRRKKSSRS